MRGGEDRLSTGFILYGLILAPITAWFLGTLAGIVYGVEGPIWRSGATVLVLWTSFHMMYLSRDELRRSSIASVLTFLIVALSLIW